MYKRSSLQLFLICVVALAVTGCATTTRIETKRIYSEVKTVEVGDEVSVTTRDGRKLEFQVTAVNAKNIAGRGLAVARADISSIKKVTTATVKTEETSAAPAVKALSTMAIVLGVIAVVAILAVF